MPDLAVTASEQTWPVSSQVFVHDVAHCLALAHQGELLLDAQGRLQPGSLQRLAAAVSLPVPTVEPRSETQAPALSFLVGLLGAAGFVADVDSTLRLAEAGSNWLGAPPAFQVRQLLDAWWLNPESNARWLSATRHQFPSHNRHRRLLSEVAGWVVSLPPSGWTPAADLEDHLTAQDLLSAAGRGHNLPRVRRATRRRLLALADFLLRVPFPCLGLADARVQGDEICLRPTPHGVAWLEAALERAHLLAHAPASAAVELAVPAEIPLSPPTGAPAFTITLDQDGDEPGLAIAIGPHAPALCTFEVAHLAHLDPPGIPRTGQAARYRLTRDSLSRALAWGYSVTDVVFLLDHFAAGGLPLDAADQLRAWGEEMIVVTWEAGFRLTTPTPDVLTALRRREPFRRRTDLFASGRDAWVSRAEAPDLWTYLRRVGYELRLPGDLNDWPLQPRLRQPLPLPQLLVILRTYGELRRLVPGLSALHSGELEQALAASLPEDDLAGVRRLVASHLVLMKHCLKRPPAEEAAGANAARDGEPQGGNEEGDTALDEVSARLQAAIDAGIELDLTYADTQGQVTRRRVRPLHIDLRWGRRYLLAHCHLRDEERHFRLDRIVELSDVG